MADLVFNDWTNLRYDFPINALILGNAFGESPYDDTRPDDPDPTIADYLELMGHGPDLLPPVVVVQWPAVGTTISPGGSVEVRVWATDETGISAVVITLDANGDGRFQPDDIVVATLNPDGSYRAEFPAITGPQGVRTIRAVAEDNSENQSAAELSVLAGDAGENGAVLQSGGGVFAAQPPLSAGGTRPIRRVGPIQVPGSGRMSISLTASKYPGFLPNGGSSASVTSSPRRESSSHDVSGLFSKPGRKPPESNGATSGLFKNPPQD